MKALWSIQEMTDHIEKLNLEFGTMENGPSRLQQQFPHLIMETHQSPQTAAAFFPSFPFWLLNNPSRSSVRPRGFAS